MAINRNKIKILLHGEEYHAKAFYKQLENYEKGIFEPKYFENLNRDFSPAEFDIIHLISSPLSFIKKLRRYGKPIINHWIGTDVYRFINDNTIKRFIKKIIVQSDNVNNLVVSGNLKKELEDFKISSSIIPLTKIKFIDEVPSLPGKFSVLTYVPKDRWDFYKGNMVLKLAEKLPDIDFHLLDAGEKDSSLKNVFYYDFSEDVTPFYKNCSALLRLTVHDGLPKMLLEALAYGRQVIWNGYFPHCLKVNNEEDCIAILNRLKNNPSINVEGKKYVEENFREEKILEDYLRFCRKLLESK